MARSIDFLRAWLVAALCISSPAGAATVPDFYWNSGMLPGEAGTGPYDFGYVPLGETKSANIGIEGTGPRISGVNCEPQVDPELSCISEENTSVETFFGYNGEGEDNFVVSEIDCEGVDQCFNVDVTNLGAFDTTLSALVLYYYNDFSQNADGSLTYVNGNSFESEFPFVAFSPVPVPPAFPLLGAGLLAAFAISRRRTSLR